MMEYVVVDKLVFFLFGGIFWEGLLMNEFVLEELIDKKNNIFYLF